MAILKFIKRLIIVLIFLTIVFIIYRYINPIKAEKFIENIESTSANIVSLFSTKDTNIVSKTTSTKGSINNEELENSLNNVLDQNAEETGKIEKNDMFWLDTLNKEIENILGRNKEEVAVDETVLTGTKEIVENIGLGMSGEVETNLNTGIVVEANTGSIIETTKKEVETVVTNTISNVNDTVKKAKKTLSDLDNQQIRNVFGNLIK